MTDREIAELLASQTAALGALVKLLVKKRIISISEVDAALSEMAAGSSGRSTAAISHLRSALLMERVVPQREQ